MFRTCRAAVWLVVRRLQKRTVLTNPS
jgi:hypothetical protein